MKQLKPISVDDFSNRIEKKQHEITVVIDYESYFLPQIQQTVNFAIGPYFWFIGSRKDAKIIAVSPNVNKLTPFSAKEWTENSSALFFANNFHPDDRNYILSASIFALETVEKIDDRRRQNFRINIYGRMLDANNEYQWRLIQFPGYYYGKTGNVESSWVLVTDISHFQSISQPMITIFDGTNIENQYFNVILESQHLIPLNIPKVSKREKEVLLLIAKGLNTPQIAEHLFISYHTVENHKRNLRAKTGTKTTGELIAFIFENNLF